MKKYRLILCDDAAMIRTNLLRLIDTHFPEIQVVGTYSDGDEALAHIAQEPVDILIADIRMERVDGLEVAKYIFENNHHTQVIIITGYHEFEYARQAIDYRVSSLITKPIDSSALIRAIRTAADTLDTVFAHDLEESRQRIRNDIQIAQSLRLFIEGGVRLELLGQDIRKTLLDSRCKGTRLLNLLLPPGAALASAALWEDRIPRKTECFEIYVMSCRNGGASCLVLDLVGDDTFPVLLSQELSRLSAEIAAVCQCPPQLRLFPLSDVARSFSTGLFGDFATYLQGITEFNPDRSKKRVGEIAAAADIDTLRIMLSLMLVYARTQAPAMDLTPFSAELTHLTYVSDAARLMQRFNTALTDALASDEALIELIRKYLYRNIASQELSLEMVSRHFGYSAEHFSRKFRQMTGSTFQSYLGSLRIQRAKELLRDPESSISWVAAQAGFKDHAYFSKVFKKRTGLLPKDYKNHIAK